MHASQEGRQDRKRSPIHCDGLSQGSFEMEMSLTGVFNKQAGY